MEGSQAMEVSEAMDESKAIEAFVTEELKAMVKSEVIEFNPVVEEDVVCAIDLQH